MARNIFSVDDLDLRELLELTRPGARPVAQEPGLRGTLALLFQQPSLRTMASFSSAGARLGLTSVAVTTTGDALRDQCDFEDEIRQLTLISECVVARSATTLDPGAFKSLPAPVINAGDGCNEHPSQTLLDVTALREEGVEGKKVTLMGNLRDHRVHHSLLKALRKLDIDVRLVSPPELTMPPAYAAGPVQSCTPLAEGDVDDVLSDTDFIYLTPVKYWNTPRADHGAAYKLDLARARRVLRRGAKILHPFPRLGELAKDLDGTDFDAYHRQTARGPETRSRLLKMLLR